MLPRLLAAFHAEGSSSVPWHSHDAAELVYVVDGRLRIDVGEAKFPGSKGTVYLLPPSQAHAQAANGNWHTVCVLFDDGAGSLDTKPRTFESSRAPYLIEWLDQLSSLSQAGEQRLLVTDCLLLTVLALLAQIEAVGLAEEGLSPRYLEAVAYLRHNVTRGVTAHELAAATNTSYSHLGQLFRQRHGCGPLQFHQKLRMDHARRVLLNPYLTISEAATGCGYPDANYFARTFVRTFGVPPGRWRKQQPAFHRSRTDTAT